MGIVTPGLLQCYQADLHIHSRPVPLLTLYHPVERRHASADFYLSCGFLIQTIPIVTQRSYNVHRA